MFLFKKNELFLIFPPSNHENTKIPFIKATETNFLTYFLILKTEMKDVCG